MPVLELCKTLHANVILIGEAITPDGLASTKDMPFWNQFTFDIVRLQRFVNDNNTDQALDRLNAIKGVIPKVRAEVSPFMWGIPLRTCEPLFDKTQAAVEQLITELETSLEAVEQQMTESMQELASLNS